MTGVHFSIVHLYTNFPCLNIYVTTCHYISALVKAKNLVNYSFSWLVMEYKQKSKDMKIVPNIFALWKSVQHSLRFPQRSPSIFAIWNPMFKCNTVHYLTGLSTENWKQLKLSEVTKSFQSKVSRSHRKLQEPIPYNNPYTVHGNRAIHRYRPIAQLPCLG